MLLNIKQIAEKWEKDKPKYNELGKLVSEFIKAKITEEELLPDISYRTKELLSIIKKIKKKRIKKSNYSYEDLNDKLGVRIICDFQEDMNRIDSFLERYFHFDNVEYKQKKLDYDKLGYISNHYDLRIKMGVVEFSTHTSLGDLVFELQVRTLNQHAWSNTAHKLSYKQEVDVPSEINRRIYRLLSLYEIADDEFSSVNRLLTGQLENSVFALINKLEGKTFKYAKLDYDRETSLRNFNVLISYFSQKEQEKIYSNIESFIFNNHKKIERIFEENRSRFHEVIYLTQPEIFLVWYALDNFFFSITDNWANDFDTNDLQYIATLWGKSIE